MFFNFTDEFFTFNLEHKNPEVFFKPFWQNSDEKSVDFLIFRWFNAAIFTIIVTKNIYESHFLAGKLRHWISYQSCWNLILTSISNTYSAILTTFYHYDKLQLSSESWCYKILWCLTNIVTVVALEISILYWCHWFQNKERELKFYFSFCNLIKNYIFLGSCTIRELFNHCANSLLMLIEIFIAGYVFRFFHFIYPFAFGVIYMIFTMSYSFLGCINNDGNNYVYFVTDWKRKPLIAWVFYIGVGFIIISMQILCILIQKIPNKNEF